MYDYNCPDCNEAKLQSDKNARKINEVIEQVNAIIDFNNEFNEHITNHPSGDNDGIINSLEPSNNDIPKVFFNGDINGMSGDNEKILRIRYSSKTLHFDEYCKIKWQGSSSLNFPKKNYTIKLFEDSECTSKSKRIFRNWVKANKFCLKANYIDSTHARNIVTAKLSRELYNEKLPIDCQGTIDGFPIWVYINGTLQGLYTWNIPKDGEQMYGMSENNPNHLMYVANRNSNGSTTQDWASQFRTLATDINEDTANGWEEEFPQTCTSENMAKLNRLISFVKDSSDEEFKRDFNQYMDLDYAISYWIYAYVGCMADNLGNNMVIITYNGLKWYPVFYDVDSTWGIRWDGAILLSDTYKCPEQYQESRSLLWEKLVRNFPTEIYNKYIELRKNVLSVEYIIEKFERFIEIIPTEKYTKDQTIWSSIPSKNYNIDQIRSYILKRMLYCDGEFAKLVDEPDAPSEPDEPDAPDVPSEPINVIGHFDTTNNFSSDLSGNNMALVLNGYNQNSNSPLVLEATGDKIAYIQDDRFSSKYTIEIDFENTAITEGYILSQCNFNSKDKAWEDGFMFGVDGSRRYVVIGSGFGSATLLNNADIGVRHKFKLSYDNGTITSSIDNNTLITVTRNTSSDCLYFGTNGIGNTYRGRAKIYSIKIWV